MSDNEEMGECIMTYRNSQYHDRDMKKWAGFFLSELSHTLIDNLQNYLLPE